MRIVFVGGGNMATALIGGLLARDVPAASIVVVEPSRQQRDALHERLGVASIERADEPTLRSCDLCVLAVKPQQMREALGGFGEALAGALVVSVAAGIRISDLARWLGGHRRIVRAMPNTPALIGRGVTGLAGAGELAQSDRDLAEHVLGTVGPTVWVGDESMLDAVTAVSGSGPAYVFLLLEAMQQAAQRLGLDDEQARTLTLHTVAGAAELALRSPEPASTLRERVTSKGGTTAAALDVLEAGGFRALFVDALEAARRRGAQMGEEFGKD